MKLGEPVTFGSQKRRKERRIPHRSLRKQSRELGRKYGVTEGEGEKSIFKRNKIPIVSMLWRDQV